MKVMQKKTPAALSESRASKVPVQKWRSYVEERSAAPEESKRQAERRLATLYSQPQPESHEEWDAFRRLELALSLALVIERGQP